MSGQDVTLKLRFDTRQAEQSVARVSASLKNLEGSATRAGVGIAGSSKAASAAASAVGSLSRTSPALKNVRDLAREIDKAMEDIGDERTRRGLSLMRGELEKMERAMNTLPSKATAVARATGGIGSAAASKVAAPIGGGSVGVTGRMRDASGRFVSGAASGLVAEAAGGIVSGGAAAAGAAAFAGVAAAAGALGVALKGAVQVGMEFDSTMSKLAAKSGASAEELARLRDQARDLGASSVFDAQQVAAAMTELAAAGMNAQQVSAAIPGVLAAAASEGMGLADAATVMSDTLTQFGLHADQSARVADVLAKAAADSSADIGQMGHTLRYAAPAAASLGMTMEDTTAAVMGLAAAGIRGEQAGTTLRGGLLSIVNPGKQAQDTMARLGFSITDQQGKVKPFSQIIGELATKTKGLSEAQRVQAVAAIVGTEASSGFLALMRQGQETLETYRAGLDDATGSAQKMADIQTDNLKGDLEALSGAWQDLQIAVSETVDGPLRDIVQSLTSVMNALSSAGDGVSETEGRLKELGGSIDANSSTLEALDRFKELLQEGQTETTEFSRLTDLLSGQFPGLRVQLDQSRVKALEYADALIAVANAQRQALLWEKRETILSGVDQFVQDDASLPALSRSVTSATQRSAQQPAPWRHHEGGFLGALLQRVGRERAEGQARTWGQELATVSARRGTTAKALVGQFTSADGAFDQQGFNDLLVASGKTVQEATRIATRLAEVAGSLRTAAPADPDPDPDPDTPTVTRTGGSSRSARRTRPQGPSAEELARREESAQRLRVQLMEESTAKRIALLEQEHEAHLETIAKSGKSEEERTAMVAEADAWVAREKEKVRSDERAKAFAESEEDARREDERARLRGATEEEILQRRMERIQRGIDAETAGSERKAQLEDELDGVRVQFERAQKERIERMDALQREQLEAMRTAARTLASDMAEQQAAEERRELARLQGVARQKPNDEGAQQAVLDYESRMRHTQIQRDMELRRSAINDAYTDEEARIKASGATQAEMGIRLFQLSAKWIADLAALKRETDTKTYEAQTQDQQAREERDAQRRLAAEERFQQKKQWLIERFAQVADGVGQWLFERERIRMEEQARLEQQRFDERSKRIDAEEQAAYDQLDAATGRKRALSAEEQAYEERKAQIAADAEKKRQKLQEEKDKADLRRAREQAIFEKKQAAWKIVLNTAIGVASALSNPLTAAMVPKIIAEGAVALAFVAAQPLPKFARGVTGFGGGVALVGEEGPELVTLGRGSNVITNENTRRLVGAAGDPATLDARLALQARLVERLAMMAAPPQYLVAQPAAFDPRIIEALNRLEARFAGVEGGFDRLAERIQDVEFRQLGTEMRATLVAEHERQSQLRTPPPI